MAIRRKVLLGVSLVTLIWGSTWLAIKVGLETIPPMLAASMRFFLASLLLFGLMRIRGVRIPRDANFRTVTLTMTLASFTIPFALIYWGQKQIPSGLASVLFATFPFWVALFAQIMLKEERMTALKSASLALGFSGVVVIFWTSARFGEVSSKLGMTAVLLAAMMQAYSLVVVKKIGGPYESLAMNFVSMIIGAVLLLLFSLVAERYSSIVMDTQAIGSLLYLAVCGTVITFVVYFWLLKHVEAVVLSLISFVTPVLAVLLGAIVLHEQLGSNVLLGAGLVLTGILAANFKEVIVVAGKGKGLVK